MPHETEFNCSVLSAWDSNLTVMRLFFCLHPSRCSRAAERMNNENAKTPVTFDYDLWTTEDGKCMVRVKRTGEVSEVDRKVMRILRAEEKRIRRSYGSDNTSEDEDGAEKISDTVLSLDAMPEDDVKSAAWLAASRDCMEELITALKEKELLSTLTEKQRELYLAMTREGLTLREFARRKGIGIRAAFDLKAAVQKKFQRIF